MEKKTLRQRLFSYSSNNKTLRGLGEIRNNAEITL